MKRTIVSLVLVLVLLLSSVGGAGLLPKANVLYGEFMPSPEFAVNRAPSSDTTENDVRTLTFTPFTDSDYVAFSKYLGAWGCECADVSSDEDLITVGVKKGELLVSFTYNRTEQSAALVYPKGTRPETENSGSGIEKDILPSIFVEMPSLSAVVLRLADEEIIDPDGNRIVTFYGVTEEEFDQFSEYLDTFGCELKDYSVSDSVMNAVIAKQGATFSFSYDTANGVCVLVYPNGTNEEDARRVIREAAAREEKWQVGNYVTFGSYPQTKAGNDDTPIEWLILARDGDKALVISRYALDCIQYNTKYTSVTWETCSLRTWLNNDFYNKAFSAEEKTNIVNGKVTADKNPEYGTNPGNDTMDNVFLLSIPEANQYFKDDSSRMCVPTDYAVKNGAYTGNKVDGRALCWCWLRSPGSSSKFAAVVHSAGSVSYSGDDVDGSNSCVRPCLVVRLF